MDTAVGGHLYSTYNTEGQTVVAENENTGELRLEIGFRAYIHVAPEMGYSEKAVDKTKNIHHQMRLV